jgi:hypothetical protein
VSQVPGIERHPAFPSGSLSARSALAAVRCRIRGMDTPGVDRAAFWALESLEFVGWAMIRMSYPAFHAGPAAAVRTLRAPAAPVIVLLFCVTRNRRLPLREIRGLRASQHDGLNSTAIRGAVKFKRKITPDAPPLSCEPGRKGWPGLRLIRRSHLGALRTKRRSILLRTFPRRSAAFLDLLGRLDRRRCSSVFCFLGKSKRLKTCPLCRAYCAFIFQLLAEERITLFRGGEVILGFAARSGAPVFIAFAHAIPFRL